MIPDFDILELIEEQLRYNPHTGNLHYRVFVGSFRPGDFAGCTKEDGYRRVSVGGRTYPAHHIAWFLHHGRWPDPELEIDHKNRVRSDNRIDNLREVTPLVNNANRGMLSTNTSGVPGVFQRGSKWVAQITHGGKKHWLGTFGTIEEASWMRAQVGEALM